ncbi:MAG: hypothetical protein ACKVU2_17700, partial [Saprospiraceae bacterium]
DLYQQQLEYIFGRPVSDPPWYHFWVPRKEEDVFGEDPLGTFVFIERLCRQAKNDLVPYTDDQVAIGLEYVFCSGMVTGFKRADVPIKRREQALIGLFGLFRDVFNPRCTAAGSADTQEVLPKISAVCQGFWEKTPLSTWVDPAYLKDEFMLHHIESMIQSGNNRDLSNETLARMRDDYLKSNTKSMTSEELVAQIQQQYTSMSEEQMGYYKAIVSVMEQCLALDNPVCVQSGLRGLDDLHPCLSDLGTCEQ